MSHLTLETLARLVDEAPAEAEKEHLRTCAVCQEELDAFRDQREAMAALPRLLPAPDAWPEIRQELQRERVLRSDARRDRASALRAAAAVLLFLGGGMSGYALRGEAGSVATPPVATPQVSSAVEEPATGPAAGGTNGEVEADATLRTGPELAASGPEASGAEAGASVEPEDAGLRQVAAAQEAFEQALDGYMATNTPPPADPAARLAALDNIVLITAEALNEAPGDPVINGYYLTAVAQRNAMLRQVEASRVDPVF